MRLSNFFYLFSALVSCVVSLYPKPKDVDLTAALLVWTAREAGADCWAELLLPSSNTLKAVHFGWDPGFRIGIGYEITHDAWDTQAYYTWFYTKGKDHVSNLPGTVYSSFLGNFYLDNSSGAGLSSVAYQSARIDWKIRFNMFDWELGRNCLVSKALALRPFFGIKGGWIDQSIHSRWQNPTLPPAEFFTLGKENLKNDFWGIGPEGGINTTWQLFSNQNHSLALFGNFSGAIMWGHWSFDDVFTNDLNQQITVDLDSENSAATTVRTFMGLQWDVRFSQDRYRFVTKLGYEMQFWLDQLRFYSFVGGRLDNQLTLQGGTLEFCFDF